MRRAFRSLRGPASNAGARLRDGARRVLTARGIEIHRTGGGGPRRTLPQVLDHLKSLGLAPAMIVDVGVARGTPELYAAFPNIPLLLVEPLAEVEDDLRRIVAERPGSRYVLAAAGPEAGELEIAVHRVPACSTVLGDREPDGTRAPRRTVPVVRIDDVVAEHDLHGGGRDRLLLKVDVEGAELHVLEGARATLERADVVLLEVSFFALNAGGAQLADVVAWMRDAGFSAYDLYSGHVRPLDGALAQIDMAFVRDDGPFRADHRYATPAQADELYRSWGY